MTDLSLDDAWLAEPSKRSRSRWLLVGLLVAALVFLGGVTVQKQYGGAAASAAGAPAGMGAGMGAMRSGSGSAEGFPAMGGGAPGDTTSSSSSSSSAGSGGSAAATDTPAVIGTVTAAKGTAWTVTDLGGTAHSVTVPSGVRVATGTTVSITGETDSSGAVTATAITIRPTQK
jgi:fibronectin-binding autotransporter adhesin